MRLNVYLLVEMIGLFTTGPALFTQMYRAFWGWTKTGRNTVWFQKMWEFE